ncbi:hypothetical protein [Streptomyces kanamyceticus]|uniref:hypothetical protein n=1 Tax=Streptomyces kanamyceticus TaxID=1967 RepID=UPI000ACC3D9E|nr:hypothetical protein [Streptomyces kanamyceticus]
MTDHPDELALAEELLVAEGCVVRAATAPEAARVGPRRAGLVVEVRLRGARRGARKAAVHRVERLAARRSLALWVRESTLCTPPRERRTPYHVRLAPPTQGSAAARRVLRLARHLTGAHDQRAVSLPGPPDRAAAVAELTASRFGDRLFDASSEEVHGPPDPPTQPGDAPRILDPTTASGLLSLCLSVAALCAGALVCLTLGGALQRLDTPWRWTALLPGLALGDALGWFLAERHLSRPRRFALGTAMAAMFLFLGYQLMLALPVAGGDVLWATSLTVLGVAGAALAGAGVWWALVPSWLSRNAHWFVPVVAAPLFFVVPWFGRLLYTLYLTVGFGVPVEAVPVTTYSMTYAALKPIGLAAGFALVFVAAAGWARHTYWGRVPGDGIPGFVLPVVAALYIVTTLLVGLITAAAATDDAAAAVKEGRNPPGYYGLHGTLMCAKPLSKDIAVYNGPLVTDRPVLTFGSTGERIWLWGFQKAKGGKSEKGDWAAMSVRLEDVVLTAPPKSDETRCA